MDFQFVPGAKRSPADFRDFQYGLLKGIDPSASTLAPAQCFERQSATNQGKFGTCVGFSSAEQENYRKAFTHPNQNLRFSPLFAYDECKKLDGIPSSEGTYPKIAMQVKQNFGSVLESDFLYSQLTDITRLPIVPTDIVNKASQFRIQSYARLQTALEIKTAIDSKCPVLTGVIVADTFMYPEGNGMIHPHSSGSILGGHAITIIGYDDDMTYKYKDGTIAKGFFIITNHWTDAWGDKGFGYLPYDFLTYHTDIGMNFFSEAWTEVDGLIIPPKTAKTIKLWIGRDYALVDGAEVRLDQSVEVDPQSNRTLAPIRFLSEQLGFNVVWNQAEQSVTLTK
jgi:C1A family cysteine protease